MHDPLAPRRQAHLCKGLANAELLRNHRVPEPPRYHLRSATDNREMLEALPPNVGMGPPPKSSRFRMQECYYPKQSTIIKPAAERNSRRGPLAYELPHLDR